MALILIGRVLASGTDSVEVVDHLEGKTITEVEEQWSGALTNTVLHTPGSGETFYVIDIWVSCSAACQVQIFDETNSDGNRMVNGFFAQHGGTYVNFGRVPRAASAADNELKITTDASGGAVIVRLYDE